MAKNESLGKSPFAPKRNSEGGKILSPGFDKSKGGHIFKRMSRS